MTIQFNSVHLAPTLLIGRRHSAFNSTITEGKLHMVNIKNFTTQELQQYQDDNKTIFFSRYAVQQLHYSVNAGYSFTKIMTLMSPFCKTKTFFAMTPDTASAYIK